MRFFQFYLTDMYYDNSIHSHNAPVTHYDHKQTILYAQVNQIYRSVHNGQCTCMECQNMGKMHTLWYD